MADIITLKHKAGGNAYAPHPAGQFVAVCCDVIDLGERVEEFPGSPAKLSHKVAIVFATGERNPETDTLHIVSAEYTASTHEKATLRRMLEAWRGQRYVDDQLKKEGLPLHKIEGRGALITVEHQVSKAGRTFAKLVSVTGVPKQLATAIPVVEDYTRAPYWQDRKEEYAAGARAFLARTATTSHDDVPPAMPDDDDLGF